MTRMLSVIVAATLAMFAAVWVWGGAFSFSGVSVDASGVAGLFWRRGLVFRRSRLRKATAQRKQMLMMNRAQTNLLTMSTEVKTIKTEIELPSDILYSQGVYKNRIGYFVKKNFLLELYREGKISLGRMAALLGMTRMEMMGIMKDSNIPLNYGAQELEEDMETAKRLGILE